jgi:N-acetylglutamate synthase-like GNAT family acetyltransferase
MINNRRDALLVRRARRNDLECVKRLLGENKLPSDHLVREIDGLYVVEDEDGSISGSACLCQGQPAELRSVCIRSEVRGKGWGRRLVETVLEEAIDRGIITLYLRTGAVDFFARLGFRELPREDLGRIWDGCSNCPRLGTDECRHVPMILEFPR